jgi:adenosylcobinamide-GDP ribazoletransferase
MKAPIVAIQFMTRLPVPAGTVTRRDMAQAIRWFPLAGLVVGMFVAVAAWLGELRDPWAGALLALIAWVWITGALHLDGLGDIADAAGAAHGDRARITAVLADPHIGSFGTVAIVLQLLTKLIALRLFLDVHPVWLLMLIPVLARIAPLGWALALPPLHEGLGRRLGAGATAGALVVWTAAAWALCLITIPALLVVLPAAVAWGGWLRRQIGGISGDGHGAGIELLEVAMLLAGGLV